MNGEHTCDGGRVCTLGAPLTAVKADTGGHDEKIVECMERIQEGSHPQPP